MKEATEMTTELMQLFPSLLPVLELAKCFGDEGRTDECKTAIKIVESYVLLGQAAFLQHYGTAVRHCLCVVQMMDQYGTASVLFK